MENRKYSQQNEPEFGLCFDVDGVLARGTLPIPAAQRMIRLLQNSAGDVTVPVAYVTNSLNLGKDKAQQISAWLDVPVDPRQVISAQTPLEAFSRFHAMHCLVIGQGKIHDICDELGFTNICTIEQVAEAYPLLDMVNHDNRKRIAKYGFKERQLDTIEAILLLGEPKHWEQPLQLIVDVLKTDGAPSRTPDCVPDHHLPVLVCNMDLQFMDRACMPRFGHGAFLVCLETLYKKVTGNELKYTSLVGKPSEITLRYAEHVLHREASKLGHTSTLKRLYMIGDTPEADIAGANLYHRYVSRRHRRSHCDVIMDMDTEKETRLGEQLPESRLMPAEAECGQQTVEECLGVLVCTGVHRAGEDPAKGVDERTYKGHRDFPCQPALNRPHTTVTDVCEAVDFILRRESHRSEVTDPRMETEQ